MKNQNPLPRFFLRSLVAAALMAAVIAPISALADNLYVSPNQDRSIFEYTPAGIQSTFASYSTNRLPRGLAFDSTGNLFAAISNFSNNHGTVVKFTPSGVQNNFGGAPGFLEGVAVDTTGDVFVVSNSSVAGTIFKFTPSGTRSVFASGLGQGFGLAFNSAGNLFAVDAVNQSIFEYTPGGTRTTFAGPAAFGNESALGG